MAENMIMAETLTNAIAAAQKWRTETTDTDIWNRLVPGFDCSRLEEEYDDSATKIDSLAIYPESDDPNSPGRLVTDTMTCLWGGKYVSLGEGVLVAAAGGYNARCSSAELTNPTAAWSAEDVLTFRNTKGRAVVEIHFKEKAQILALRDLLNSWE